MKHPVAKESNEKTNIVENFYLFYKYAAEKLNYNLRNNRDNVTQPFSNQNCIIFNRFGLLMMPRQLFVDMPTSFDPPSKAFVVQDTIL